MADTVRATRCCHLASRWVRDRPKVLQILGESGPLSIPLAGIGGCPPWLTTADVVWMLSILRAYRRGPRLHRRVWQPAGCVAVASIVLTSARNAFEHSLMLGDKPSAATSALIHSSMAKNFAGGYVGLVPVATIRSVLTRLATSEWTTAGMVVPSVRHSRPSTRSRTLGENASPTRS
jgi:hypothetical protein